MPSVLTWDSDVIYDSPDYTWDGYFLGDNPLTIQEALSRELRYGEALDGLVDPGNVHMEMRLSATRDPSAYPAVIFRRITSSEDNRVRYARERWEIEVIGQLTNPDTGDDALEAIKESLLEQFAGKHRTFGAFDSDGTENPYTGLRMKCFHVNTLEFIDEDIDEKAHIHIFVFTYIRS